MDVVEAGKVSEQESGVAPGSGDALDHLFAAFPVATGDEDLRTLLGQQLGGVGPDAALGPGPVINTVLFSSSALFARRMLSP
ncbi:hypothetical protein SVIO_026830 [Streptomyces violaceusniger]|uniref:Uncharacterized protein n=1 Tax=Streptomyces violaceusniger TaxID=68280 RepID=A0A4D4KZT1_STRVO|nr:hypothetical protein SVIO_026830 [Streptomyces violaceusniger]